MSGSNRTVALFAGIAALTLAGCASGPAAIVEVDAIRRAGLQPGQSYRLESTNRDIDQDSTQFTATVRSVKAAMAAKGLRESAEAAKPDFIVDMDFGVEGPVQRWVKGFEEIYEYRLPEPIVLTRKLAEGLGGDTRYQEYTVQPPAERVYVGDRDIDVLKTVYEMYLTLIARRNLPTGETDTLWSVNATLLGPTSALPHALPMLLEASSPLLGADTQGTRAVKVHENRDPSELDPREL